jgi:hypothetical protein
MIGEQGTPFSVANAPAFSHGQISSLMEATAPSEPGAAYESTQRSTLGFAEPRFEPSTPRLPKPPSNATPAQRYALNTHLGEALEHARNMEAAAVDADVLTLASEGVLLTTKLSLIWRLRHLREDDWRSIINFVQGVIAKVEFEHFNQKQCATLVRILERHIHPDANDEDVRSTVMLLERAGFNAWRGISDRETTEQ